MNHGPAALTTLDVPFSSFPLGMTLRQRWVSDNQSEFYVEKCTLLNDATRKVKPGYILRRVNGIALDFETISELHTFLKSFSSKISTKTPLLCSFHTIDSTGQGTPLFDPFSNTNELQNACNDQTVQKFEHTSIGLPMTTFPRDSMQSIQPCANTGYGQGLGQIATTNGHKLQGGCGGIAGGSSWLNANDVINANDLQKHMLNIDSNFRYSDTQATSDFIVKLDPQLKNIIRIRLASAEIPNTFYEFSYLKRNIELRLISVTHGTDHAFTIKQGNYDAAQLQTALNNIFLSFIPQYQITIDPISAKTNISTVDFSEFIMDFRTQWNSREVNPSLLDEPSYDWGLGYNLGYRKKYYSGATYYESEAIINTMGDPYIFLKMNDFYSVQEPMKDGNIIEAFTKILLRTDKNSEIFNDCSDLLTREYIFPQPKDINRLHVKIVDKYNNVIDLNDMPVSLSIELTEVKNCKLYDFYRNYLFQSKLLY